MPTAAEYLRPELIAQVDRLDLRARFIIEGFYAGLHASPYRGFSVEFSEHRRYTPGDDPRTIDWNVYAKSDRFFVKQFRAETNLEAYLLMDVSASMGFPAPEQIEPGGPPRMSKLDYAVCLAAALGYMMVRQQDSAGLALLGTEVRQLLPPRSTRAHLMRVLSELAAARPAGSTALADSLHDVARRVRKRGLMILFSDLLCDAEPVIEALHRLRFGGHDVIVFCVLDRAEAEFPYVGPTRFEDPEGGDPLSADAASVRGAYLDALHALHQRYRDAAAAARCDFVAVNNTMSFDAALVRFLLDRQARF